MIVYGSGEMIEMIGRRMKKINGIAMNNYDG